MEGRTKTGDINNICGGRFGGLLFFALRSSSIYFGLAVQLIAIFTAIQAFR
jgi:hypothetical protein